jgi:hypothetical protein
MSPRVLSSHFVFFAGVACAAVSPGFAQIAVKSPFMPPQAATTGPTPGAPLEYRGYLETGEGRLFRIYDPSKKASTWVKVDERNTDFGVTAKQYDEGQKTLTIDFQGKTITLAERESKVVSSGAAPAALPPPIAPVPTNVSPAVTQAVVLNPTPADEQRRLDAVAAEVARRRALREQATQNLGQGTPPQITLPQGMQPPAQPQRSVQPPPQGNFPQQVPMNTQRRPSPSQPGATR